MSTTSASFGSLKKLKPKRRVLRKYTWLADVLRIKGSVFWRILGPVLTITLFATGVGYAYSKGVDVTLTNDVVPLLAVVVGLILVFRNSTSYDRYYEGRKDFGTMTSNIRNMARLIWVNVQVQDDALGAQNRPANITRVQVKVQKIRAVKLLMSYAIATKHHLRGEYETDYEDFKDVLPGDLFGKRRNTLSDSCHAWAVATSSITPWSRIAGVGESTALLGDPQSLDYHAYEDEKKYAFPLIILHELTRTLTRFKQQGLLETPGPAGLNGMNQIMQSMCDCLTAMERICNTPIPSSYGIHLKQCVTLYLFALPFTLVRNLGWRMIPIVTVVAFTLMGIEGIANEIEMPFGREQSDLPLDRYTLELRAELEYLIEMMPEGYTDDYYRD